MLLLQKSVSLVQITDGSMIPLHLIILNHQQFKVNPLLKYMFDFSMQVVIGNCTFLKDSSSKNLHFCTLNQFVQSPKPQKVQLLMTFYKYNSFRTVHTCGADAD